MALARFNRCSHLFRPCICAPSQQFSSLELPSSLPQLESPPINTTGLPLAQRCKNILAANWRGQLATVNAREEPAIMSTLVRYLAHRSISLVVLLDADRDADYIRNLTLDPRASLTVGATDPQGLMTSIKLASRHPARVSLSVNASLLAPGEVAYAARQLRKTHAGVPGYPEPPDERTVQERMVGYACSLRSARYVDTVGMQHSVPADDVDGAITDPLARGQASLTETLNKDTEKRHALTAFCGAYMGVPVSDALLMQADRAGFTVLGLPVSASDSASPGSQPNWREFRFSFNRETTSLDSFMSVLAEMEREVADMTSA